MKKGCLTLLAFLMLAGGIPSAAEGLKLFSPQQREGATPAQRVVMDFLERYFGQELPALKETSAFRKMRDDKVYFRKGAPENLAQVADTMPLAISLFDRYYEVSWLKSESPFVTIVFPVQYDLLVGKSQEQSKQQLREAIVSESLHHVSGDLKSPETASALTRLPDGIYMARTDSFVLASLSDAIYYYDNVRANRHPVFDDEHPAYSAANLFLGQLPDADYRLYVEQSAYGMKTISYTITLGQWLRYCAYWGMKVYFAVEEEREDGLLVMVLAQCRELGFNHLLSVVIPDKFFAGQSGQAERTHDQQTVLKARLTPYIPTHNVKNLYQQQSTNRKKIKWQ